MIKAFNEDLPFDQFTIQQLAGDLLPKATIENRVATGFHRNTLTNREGGVDPEEDLVVVYFTQVIPATGLDDQGKLRALVYQAIVD